MSTVKSAAEGHLCHSRGLSAAPHASLFYPTHFKGLVDAWLFISHQLCDAKELNMPPRHKTPEAKVCGVRYCRSCSLKQSRFPKSCILTSLSCLEILHFIFLGKQMLGQSAQLCCKWQWSPCYRRSEQIGSQCISCPMASPPLFSSWAACTPSTVLDLVVSAAPPLPIPTLDFVFSEPGKGVAMLSVSFYWFVQGRI